VSRGRYPWLFSPAIDLSVFLGSALFALALVGVGAATGDLATGTPEWTWVPAILLIDVAHVWATGFRVYLDADELRRRPWLYALAPLGGWVIGVALYSESPMIFWRTLAYLAVFHFVRQQYGWVALYRRRGGEPLGAGRFVDTAAIYAATIFPLLWWHAHLPRDFWWFLPGDFAAAPDWMRTVAMAAAPVYAAALLAYAVRSALAWRRGRGNPGKDIVVATTAVCWFVGIVALDSDYAFTVTNVIIHGVPYFAIVYLAARARLAAGARGGVRLLRFGPGAFLGLLWLAAYAEELLWDRAVWHDRPWLFGGSWHLADLHVYLVPLLALPQITHYVLDGFIWRGGQARALVGAQRR